MQEHSLGPEGRNVRGGEWRGRNSTCALTRRLSLQPLAFWFKDAPERGLGVPPSPRASRRILHRHPTPSLFLGKRLLASRAAWAPGSNTPPACPTLWATSLTNFPVGRETHVPQKSGLSPELCLHFPSASEPFLFPLLPFLPGPSSRFLSQVLRGSSFSSFWKDLLLPTISSTSLHPSLTHPRGPGLHSEAGPPSSRWLWSLGPSEEPWSLRHSHRLNQASTVSWPGRVPTSGNSY